MWHSLVLRTANQMGHIYISIRWFSLQVTSVFSYQLTSTLITAELKL